MTGLYFDELKIGQKLSTQITMTEAHIVAFAGLSGDFNPLHMNEEFARTTRFGQRIAHGALTYILMTAPLGNNFSGTAVAYLSQKMRFTAPVFIGDTLTYEHEIIELDPKKSAGIVTIKNTVKKTDGTVVLEGEGKIMVAYKK